MQIPDTPEAAKLSPEQRELIANAKTKRDIGGVDYIFPVPIYVNYVDNYQNIQDELLTGVSHSDFAMHPNWGHTHWLSDVTFDGNFIKDNINIWKKFFISNINDDQIEIALKTLKLDSYLNKKVGTLSFGETKKLEFLRLIIENKKVWILDEPLSNLDEDSIELMKQTFEDHCSKEGSIIFSSHQNPGIYVTEEIQL